jgi:hypothetical protein
VGVEDQKQFTGAMAQARAGGHINFFGDPYASSDAWVAALHACNRLAMFDMLPALRAISPLGQDDIEFVSVVEVNKNVIGQGSVERIKFACTVVRGLEIEDRGVPDDQVNDGREFLGCTRLDNSGVQQEIQTALSRAVLGRAGEPCCGVNKAAWLDVLVPRRRLPGGSLIANVAAAAHYMLARYHVCAAKAFAWQMKTIIDAYDEKKRNLIANGDRDLKGVALTGNRPFPPDFAIRKWGYKGADDGKIDRLKCNSRAIRSPFPDVNGQEY